MSASDICPQCGERWVNRQEFSNEAMRVRDMECKNGHTWNVRYEFTGFAADGTRCYVRVT